MKKRFFTLLTLTIAVLALTAAGEEKPLSLSDTRWKLAGFVDAETGEGEEPDYSMYGPCCTGVKPTPPDMSTDDWFTLVFLPDTFACQEECQYYLGKLTSDQINGTWTVDYVRSTINLADDTWLGIFDNTNDGQRYYWALKGSQTFELTDTYLKIYYLTRNGDKLEYLLFRPWEPAPSKVHDADRTVLRSRPDKEATAVILPPEIILSPSVFAAGPNPISKSADLVNFYRTGKQVKSASLKIYDASGKAVGKISIKDGGGQGRSKRRVGSWNLKDAKGRRVTEGVYLVRGALKTVDGRSERIGLLIGVR